MNIIKRIFLKVKSLYRNKELSFPYQKELICKHNSSIHALFEINNPIENYRLAQWGNEQDYVENLLNELNADDILYDIGSSVGLISVLSACKCINGRVVCFEPDLENVKRLKTNFIINNLVNREIHQIAIGDKNELLELFTNGSNDKSPSLKPVNNISNKILVQVDSIDNLIEKKELIRPTVIKIDIEGAEMLALKGMKKLLLNKNRPRLIFLEIHPDFLTSFGYEINDIFKFVINSGYKFTSIIQRDEQILCKLMPDQS